MPAKNERQRKAAGIALAAKRGDIAFSQLGASARQMARSMNERQLRDFAKKGKK